MTTKQEKILVTGAGGFLGKHIAIQLLKQGYKVRSFARGSYPELEQLGIEAKRGDLADKKAVLAACQGIDGIFHVAAKAGVWGSFEDYYNPNVIGTRNILEAQRELAIKHLVYTSTPSVTFAGQDQEGVDETEPHAKRFFNHYQSTKATAETLVLNANSQETKTVALRPHLIWGPGDTQLVPRVIKMKEAGRLKFINGGTKKVDAVYIDNAAKAHLLAFEKLKEVNSTIGGKVYFVTNQDPWPLKDVINGILAAKGLEPVNQSVPAKLAYTLGAMLEGTYKLLGKRDDPPMTRFVAKQLATSHWYNADRAKRDLGYSPDISMHEGMRRLAQSFD